MIGGEGIGEGYLHFIFTILYFCIFNISYFVVSFVFLPFLPYCILIFLYLCTCVYSYIYFLTLFFNICILYVCIHIFFFVFLYFLQGREGGGGGGGGGLLLWGDGAASPTGGKATSFHIRGRVRGVDQARWKNNQFSIVFDT